MEYNEKVKDRDKLDGFDDFESQNPDFRLKIGIIDFLTKYNKQKLFENEFKSRMFRVKQEDISAIDSLRYQKRFIEFMKTNF